MVLVDTGALYALGDRGDVHHKDALAYFRQAQRRESLALPICVLTEATLLVEARLGMRIVRRLWDDVVDGVFDVLAETTETLVLAREIDRRYSDANLGIVDCSCLALCEQHRITTVFTYDRGHFALYRPAFTEALTLAP